MNKSPIRRARSPGKSTRAVTDIVSIVYCERKACFDRQYGEQRSAEQQKAATAGSHHHQAFEALGHREMAGDRRCFIATAVYGADAAETEVFRAWRDRALLPSFVGRLLIAAYYGVSPGFVRLTEAFPSLLRLARFLLDRILVLLRRRGEEV